MEVSQHKNNLPFTYGSSRVLAGRPGFSLFLLIYLFPVQVQALDVIAAIKYEPEYTNNTLRTEQDEIEELIHKPGIDLTLSHNTATLQLDANYDYERRIYTQEFWTDENVTRGASTLQWHAVAERLDFTASNTRTETTVRAFQGQTQANRQVVSTTELGSALIFRPRGKDTLQLEYAFLDIKANRTQTDSSRNNGTISYNLALSANDSIELKTTYSDISYQGIFPDATSTIATLGYLKTTGDLELDIKFGHNWYDREGRGKSDDSTYELTLAWRLSADSTLSFNAFQGIVDQSSRLTSNSGSDGQANENSGVNAAFNETRGSLTYRQIIGRTTFDLNGYWTQEKYAKDIPLDSDRYGFRLSVSRNLTSRTSVNLNIDYVSRDFVDRGDKQDEARANFRVTHRLGRALSLDWGASYERRKSQTNFSYEEVIASVKISYTFESARRKR